MEQLCLTPEGSTAVIGVLSLGIMWLARNFLSFVNNLSGLKKMAVMLVIPQLLSVVSDAIGIPVPSINDLTTNGVVVPFTASLLGMGLWAGQKETMKVMGRYNLSPKGGSK